MNTGALVCTNGQISSSCKNIFYVTRNFLFNARENGLFQVDGKQASALIACDTTQSSALRWKESGHLSMPPAPAEVIPDVGLDKFTRNGFSVCLVLFAQMASSSRAAAFVASSRAFRRGGSTPKA